MVWLGSFLRLTESECRNQVSAHYISKVHLPIERRLVLLRQLRLGWFSLFATKQTKSFTVLINGFRNGSADIFSFLRTNFGPQNKRQIFTSYIKSSADFFSL